MSLFAQTFQNRRVLVTGHTGFKGSWLTLWLQKLGAQVAGFSLSVPTQPAHYDLTGLRKSLAHETMGDIRDLSSLQRTFETFQPEILFHLAAEPIVSTCLHDPKLAFDTNLGGTVNVLECIKRTPSLRSAVLITSDKCYENVEWDYGYREDDRLGGKDPYSASKACAEIAFSAYFRSYLKNQPDLSIATARAGNVIGGGDWAKDRIIADCVRAVTRGDTATIRSPEATRPWQLVLEPLSGYLWLASQLWNRRNLLNGEAFNFGPRPEVEVTVSGLLTEMHRRWPRFDWKVDATHAIRTKEASLLKLNCDKALRRLDWRATLTFPETMDFVSSWYQTWNENPKADIQQLSLEQIARYETLAKERQLSWTQTAAAR